MTRLFRPQTMALPRYLFFTGKGGVGKTSIACATAVALADQGKRVLLVSTDPASNLQDVFDAVLTMKITEISEVPNLFVSNLNPEEAAARYREKVIAPYRGLLPDAAVKQMEEQLSGSCTVEIAAFDVFSSLLTNRALDRSYDHILFDTAPTGHTLRLLQLPGAWSGFLNENTQGTSCLGPLAGLNDKKEQYLETVQVLADEKRTMMILVARPELSTINEAARASRELTNIGMNNQHLVINGQIEQSKTDDALAAALVTRQHEALANLPQELRTIPVYHLFLAPCNMTGVRNIRKLLSDQVMGTRDQWASPFETKKSKQYPELSRFIDELIERKQRVVFTMGKGGVGKTTLARTIALELAARGEKVHLTTTDPAGQCDFVSAGKSQRITVSRIDPKTEVKNYRKKILERSREQLDDEGLAYLEEDLKSPCTEEIAVFRAFAELVQKADDTYVVIDTAPSGHTLLLLDATEEYHREIAHAAGTVPKSIQQLLPRLRNPDETAVVIVMLPEPTPVFEAERLTADLERAGIRPSWWVVNQSLMKTCTNDPLLKKRSVNERIWIERVDRNAGHRLTVIPWQETDEDHF